VRARRLRRADDTLRMTECVQPAPMSHAPHRETATHLVVGAQTDKGLRRARNEDAFALAVERGLLLVSDGMGGHRAGDTASRAVASVLPSMLVSRLESSGADTPVGDILRDAIVDLSQELRAQSHSDPELEGLGATVVLALIRGEMGWVAHMGDSRAYRLRAGRLERLTEDHSLAAVLVRRGELPPEEAERRADLTGITRYVGMEGAVDPDVQRFTPEPGDRYLLCSDGLTCMLDDAAIGALLSQTADPVETCRQLVEAANGAGGRDNITVIVGDWRCRAR
jgi:PPM family protein phosphatase